MATAIITLVNKALEKVQEIPITPTEFDSGLESHNMVARRAVEDILQKMYLVQKDEKLKCEFTLTTVASQTEYSLGFDGSLLADTQLRVIKSDLTDYWLTYLTEYEALNLYVDFANLTLQAQPQEWWFRTGSSNNTITIRFNPIPDAIYTIKGFKYTPYSEVNSISITPFTSLGDSVIIDYVASQLAQQYYREINAAPLMAQYEEKWSKYLLENQNTNNHSRLAIPYQADNYNDSGNYYGSGTGRFIASWH